MRLLLIEDDAVLREVLHRSLTAHGHQVDTACSAVEARYLWRVQPYDVALLDLNLPDGDGLYALAEARARGDRTPVLVITARDRTDDRIAVLDAGADDYIVKPFDLREVEARLRALIRRAYATEDRCAVGSLVLDRRSGRFFRTSGHAGSHWLDLPTRERTLLMELMTPPGRVVSKRDLSNKLSSVDETLGDNALETFVSRLRKRIDGSGARIRTIRGLGYLVEEDADAAARAGAFTRTSR